MGTLLRCCLISKPLSYFGFKSKGARGTSGALLGFTVSHSEFMRHPALACLDEYAVKNSQEVEGSFSDTEYYISLPHF